MTLRMGEHAHQSWLTWCEESMCGVRARMREENRNGKPVSVAAVLDSGHRPQGRSDTHPRRTIFWVLPALIGVPVIFMTVAYYQPKFIQSLPSLKEPLPYR